MSVVERELGGHSGVPAMQEAHDSAAVSLCGKCSRNLCLRVEGTALANGVSGDCHVSYEGPCSAARTRA